MPTENIDNQNRSISSSFRTNVFLLGVFGTFLALGCIGLYSIWRLGDAGVPKTAELEIYAGFISAFALWLLFSRRWAGSLDRACPTFWYASAVLLPIVALANISPGFFTQRMILLAGIGAAGLLLGTWECTTKVQNDRPSPMAQHVLAGGMLLAIILTIVLSASTTFQFLSVIPPAVFIGAWLLMEKVRIPCSNRVLTGIVLAALALFFLWVKAFMDREHYAYILGPVAEATFGHPPLSDVAPQYGPGLTLALAGYFRLLGRISNGGFVTLLRILTWAQFALVFVIARSMTRSKLLALAALCCALLFAFFSQGTSYFFYPSTTFLRFGFPLVLCGVECIPEGTRFVRWRFHLLAIVAAVASLWSFESMIYSVPAVVAAEWTAGRTRRFLPILLAYIGALWGGYLLILVGSGHVPDVLQFTEYTRLFAGGFGQIPLERLTGVWWLFPLIALWSIGASLTDDAPDERSTLLAVSGLAIFTYFVGRAHPNNLHHVSLPFILLLFWSLSRLTSRRWQCLLAAGILATAVAVNVTIPKDETLVASIRDLMVVTRDPDAIDGNAEVLDDCRYFQGFQPFVRSGTLALIDPESTSVNIYPCIGAANTFGINPFKEAAVSPRAVARAAAFAYRMPHHTILIGNIDPKDQYAPLLASAILEQLVLTGDPQVVTIDGRPFHMVEGQGKGMVEL